MSGRRGCNIAPKSKKLHPYDGREAFTLRVGQRAEGLMAGGTAYCSTTVSQLVNYSWKEGVVEYIHPAGRFVTLRFKSDPAMTSGEPWTWTESYPLDRVRPIGGESPEEARRRLAEERQKKEQKEPAPRGRYK